MRYLLSEDVTYEKVWLELQALAWNNPELRQRLAHVNAEWCSRTLSGNHTVSSESRCRSTRSSRS